MISQEATPKGHRDHECHHTADGKIFHYISDRKWKSSNYSCDYTRPVKKSLKNHVEREFDEEIERDLILQNWFVQSRCIVVNIWSCFLA